MRTLVYTISIGSEERHEQTRWMIRGLRELAGYTGDILVYTDTFDFKAAMMPVPVAWDATPDNGISICRAKPKAAVEVGRVMASRYDRIIQLDSDVLTVKPLDDLLHDMDDRWWVSVEQSMFDPEIRQHYYPPEAETYMPDGVNAGIIIGCAHNWLERALAWDQETQRIAQWKHCHDQQALNWLMAKGVIPHTKTFVEAYHFGSQREPEYIAKARFIHFNIETYRANRMAALFYLLCK